MCNAFPATHTFNCQAVTSQVRKEGPHLSDGKPLPVCVHTSLLSLRCAILVPISKPWYITICPFLPKYMSLDLHLVSCLFIQVSAQVFSLQGPPLHPLPKSENCLSIDSNIHSLSFIPYPAIFFFSIALTTPPERVLYACFLPLSE